MKIFIDSADIDQIQEAFSWGIVDGITTNPSLIKKSYEKVQASGEKISMHDYICRILENAEDTPVSLEVIGPSEKDMTAQGRFLYETFNRIAGNVVVKIPVNPNLQLGGDHRYDGLKSIRSLAQSGIPVNCTLIFTPEQAWAAAKAGAAYVSPFAGRIDDMLRKRLGGEFSKTDYYPAEGKRDDDGNLVADDNGVYSGVHLVEQCVDIFQAYDLDCEVLAASLRNPRQVRECALVAADVSTIPFAVIRDMVEHPKTVEGMNAFCADVVPEYRDLLP
ncbi:MAG: transaldolase [Planctomycetes bacterium]|nr:transaldolase [Planctomycetota bacterium]